MMELLPLIKSIIEVVVAPILLLMIWFLKGYLNTMKEMDKRVTSLEKDTAKDVAVILTKTVKNMDKRVTLLEKDTAKDVAVILTKLENLDEKVDRIEKLLERK